MKIKIKLSGELTKEEVKELISRDNNAVMKAALLLYNHQTKEEKLAMVTKETNKRGFNSHDAPKLSSFARYIISHNGAMISDIEKNRYMIMKYSQQIADITNEKKDLQLEWSIKNGN